MILWYLRLNVNVMFFKFLFIHKTFFAQVCLLMMYLTWQNFVREKWRHKVAKILRGFDFVLFSNLVFMCKVASLESMLIYLDFSLE